MQMSDHIFPVFDRMLSRSDFEQNLSQRAKVIWMTGLSGSGKSTLALGLQRRLLDAGFVAQCLDGDNLRSGLCADLSFSQEDRLENIRRVAELSKLFVQTGIIVISSFISPMRSMRHKAKQIVGAEDFLEVYVDASLEQCERRDVKGLYQKARAGEISRFTGIDAPYEPPEQAFLTICTDKTDVQESIDQLFFSILPQIRL